MHSLADLFSIKTIALTVPDLKYEMSYLELVGDLFTLWAVWLEVKRKVLTWPVGLIGIVLFLVMFYQSALYADATQQLYYFLTGVWGWVAWSRSPKENDAGIRGVGFSPPRQIVIVAVVSVAVGLVAGYGYSQINHWLPAWFPQPAAYPYFDSVAAVLGFTAQWLLIRKRTENWAYWIVANAMDVCLYWVKDLKFTSLLYGIFTVMAVRGLLDWRRAESADPAPVQEVPQARSEAAR